MNSVSRGRKRNKKRKVVSGCVVLLIGAAFLCVLSRPGQGDKKEKGTAPAGGWTVWLEEDIAATYLPVFAFIENETGIEGTDGQLTKELILSALPIYRYSDETRKSHDSMEDENTYDLLIRQEGSDEDRKAPEEGSLEYEPDAMHIDGDLQSAMLKENQLHNGDDKQDKEINEQTADGEEQEKETADERKNMDTERAGNGEFCSAQEKSYEYAWSQVKDYEELVSAFYAIDSTTSITDAQLNLGNLLGRDMGIEKKEEPQILIYHTHSQEAFADSVEGDASTTIVGAGDKLARLLEEKYGYHVLHHTGSYDVDSRDYAYSNALPAIEQLLAEYPSIEVVIDLHRDAMEEGKKLVVDLQGRPTAQFMFFNGLSRTRKNGDIDYLENPYVDDNLAFSFQAQVAANEYYPGVARRIYLKAYRYNMHLRARSMLIELGAQTNTVEEIMNACDPLAHVIAKVLSGETGDTARLAAGMENE